MSESREPYTVPNAVQGQWVDLRFDDRRRTHTGVRILRGTTVIEVVRDGNRLVVDIAQYLTAKISQNHDMIGGE